MSTFSLGKKIYLSCFFIVVIFLLFLAFLQYFQKVFPCSLTYIERIILLILGMLFLAAILQTQTTLSKKIYAYLSISVSAIGIIVTGRHVWVQYHNLSYSMPSAFSQSPSYLSGITSIKQFLILIYSGGGPYACKISWQWLHISLAGWTLGIFILLGCACLLQVFRER